MKALLKKMRKKEEGAVLVLVALLLTILLGFTALALDFGMAYYQRAKLQSACDAAALAGATKLPNIAQAGNLAKLYMQENGYTDANSTITVTFDGAPASKIKVTSTFQSTTTFAQVFGQDDLTVACAAAAGKKTIRKRDEFKYLLFSKSGELHLGGDGYYVAGSVYGKTSINADVASAGGYAAEYCVGDSGTFSKQGGTYINVIKDDGSEEQYYVYKLKSDGDTIQSPWNDRYSTITQDAALTDYVCVNTKDLVSNDSLSEKVADEGYSWYYLSQFMQNKTEDYPSGLEDECEAKIQAMEYQYNTKMNAVKNSIAGRSTAFAVDNWRGNSWNKMNAFYNNASPISKDTVVVDEDNTYATTSKDNTFEYTFALNRDKNNAAIDFQGGKKVTYEKGLIFYCNNPESGFKQSFTSVEVEVNEFMYSNANVKIMGFTSWGAGGAVSKNAVFNGDIYVDGDLYLNKCIINGDVYATGDIEIDNCTANGFIAADGNIKFTGETTFASALSYDLGADPLSIYSRNGNIDCISGGTGLTMAGILFAPKGNVNLQNGVTFYGNIIGDTVTNISKTVTAYPLSMLPGYNEANADKILKPGSGDTTEEIIVLVE